jgi:pSer/pThr/pTyr-binding forkhead associated (FHA) protein
MPTWWRQLRGLFSGSISGSAAAGNYRRDLAAESPDPPPHKLSDNGLSLTSVKPLESDQESTPTLPATDTQRSRSARRKPPAKVPDRAEISQPQHRQRVPILHVLDDDQESAEKYRIRRGPITIGRTSGDILIVHDAQISDPHAEIGWHASLQGERLRVRDLQSATGLFARVYKTRLGDQQQIRIGGTVLQFLAAGVVQEIANPARHHEFGGEDVWIGRDASACAVVIDDPMVCGTHVRIWKEQQQWYLQDSGSVNGTWVRTREFVVATKANFMLGEQVFAIELPV